MDIFDKFSTDNIPVIYKNMKIFITTLMIVNVEIYNSGAVEYESLISVLF